MRTNHINLCSSDVKSLTGIFVRHFAYRVIVSGKVPEHVGVLQAGTDFAMLDGSDGFSIVISQIDPEPQPAFPANFHVGIMLDAADQVYAKHEELSEAGYQPGSISSFETLGSRWTAFYCPVGDGINIEVNSRVPIQSSNS